MIIEILNPDSQGGKYGVPVELTAEEKEKRMKEHIDALILAGKIIPPKK